MERANAIEQIRVGHGALRGRPRAPSVVPAGGDAQHAAQPADLMGGPMRPHELESFGGVELVSRANQAAAFFRISFSSRRILFSRRSFRSSSRSSVISPSAR